MYRAYISTWEVVREWGDLPRLKEDVVVKEGKRETGRKYQSFHKEWQLQFATAEQNEKPASLLYYKIVHI